MKKGIVVVMLICSLFGCVKSEKNEYSKLLYEEEYLTVLEMDGYVGVLEDILTYKLYDERSKELVREKYTNCVEMEVFNKLESLPVLTAKSLFSGVKNEDVVVPVGEYPIYSEYGDIENFGDKLQSEESLKKLYNKDLNKVEGARGNASLIVLKLNNRYNKRLYVLCGLRKGRVVDINILGK